MQASEQPPLELTSTVIEFSATGDYSYDVLGFLVAHEMFRREFRLAANAIASLDAVNHTWHATALHEWFFDYLIPLLEAHSEVEGTIVFPFHVPMGIACPKRQAEDHIALLNRAIRFKHALEDLTKLVSTNPVTNVKEQESVIKSEFAEFILHWEEHFAEEEMFWPKILRRCGQGNWDKIAPQILNLTLSFGELNAGDPYRNLMCSTPRAMGIMITGDDPFDLQTETRWTSKQAQQTSIDSLPFLVRNVQIPLWNERVKGFRRLITSIGNKIAVVEDAAVVTNKNKKNNKKVAKIKKLPIPLFTFFTLTLYFCLTAAPYFAAVSNPVENRKLLQIDVVDNDGRAVGQGLVAFLKAQSNDAAPTFHFLPDYSYTKAQVSERVLDEYAWAAVYINANATYNLDQVLANDCKNLSSYSAASAFGYVWDEGRNNIVAAPEIQGYLNGLLPIYASIFASTQLASLPAANVTACLANGGILAAQFLSQPIFFIIDNLTPVSISYVAANAGVIVGNILIATFGATYAVQAALGSTQAITEDLSPKKKVAVRVLTMMFFGFGLSMAFAVMMVGLTYNGSSGYLYDGNHFAQVFGIQWLHICLWSFGHAWELETLGQGLMPFFFGFFLNFSILAGWNLDLAFISYKNFFQIFPFYWVIQINRYTFFGSQRTQRKLSAGILIAYFFVMLAGYVCASLINEYKRISDTRLIREEDASDDIEHQDAVDKAMDKNNSYLPVITGALEIDNH